MEKIQIKVINQIGKETVVKGRKSAAKKTHVKDVRHQSFPPPQTCRFWQDRASAEVRLAQATPLKRAVQSSVSVTAVHISLTTTSI